MKKITLLFMTFFTFTTISFASFPGTPPYSFNWNNGDTTEDVDTEYTEFVSNNQSESKAPGSKITGILLGFFLGPIGVLIAYLMDDTDMLRGAWRGFLLGFVLGLVLVIAIFSFLIRVASSTTLY